MMKRAVLGVCILLALVSRLPAAQEVAPVRVARISYGTQRTQIGVAWAEENGMYDQGLRGLAVDNEGNFYLGDYVNGKVKKFSPQGAFLTATEGVFENIQFFTLDRKGNIIVHDEGRGSQIAKFGGNGKLVWSRSFSEVMARYDLKKLEKDYSISLGHEFHSMVTMGAGDSLIAEISGTDLTTNKVRRLGLELDSDGKLIRVLPVFGIESGGRLWTYQKSTKGGVAHLQVQSYADDGTSAKHVTIKRKAAPTASNAENEHLYKAMPDRRGGFFTISAIRPTKTTPASDAIGVTDHVLDRYDAQGNWVQRLLVPGSTFVGSIGSNLAVAADGTVYWCKFDKNGLDIMKYGGSN